MTKLWVEVDENDFEVAISAVEKLADQPLVPGESWVEFHKRVASSLRGALQFARMDDKS